VQQCWGDGRDENQQGLNRGHLHFPIKLNFTIPECISAFVMKKKFLQVVQFVSFTLEKKIMTFWFLLL